MWIGILEVELETWSIRMLREEVAKRSNCNPNSVNLICAGKILKDGDGQHNLTQLGIKNNAKILATRICVEQGKAIKQEIMAEEEHSHKLARVKAAAIAVAKRHVDDLLPIENFTTEVEGQMGKKIKLASETDHQRAIMTGLVLEANGKRLIRQGKYKDALEVLSMAEETFSLCDDSDTLELIDIIPIMQINMVWCYFMMQDISSLSEAGKLLAKAREGLEDAYGKHALRARLLKSGCFLELAWHLRLELLEGVVAYYSGQLDTAREALLSAQAKFEKLQVSDEDLSLVMSMGFTKCDAKRALKMNLQNIQAAVNFLIEENAEKDQKQKERESEIRKQKPVDLQRLNELESVGFEKDIAAEALRRNGNVFQKALNDLTHPETFSALQAYIESEKGKIVEEIRTSAALAATEADPNIIQFETMGGRMTTARVSRVTDANMQREVNPSGGASSSSSSLPPQINAFVCDLQDPSNKSEAQKRDVEMEDELSADIAESSDALADYDIEVDIEGAAITEYLSLVETAAGGRRKEEEENYSVE
ncbi:hypothetical protein JHK82_047160 [Glycine max]|uniref:UBA domain-containing protein n=2 Tax=Glycine subgen. Soja TaxID=1462606 RepID=A0A0R0FBE4_SOYBN|nr:hypothetical protein JHK86_047051 [Glycine max]KAG4942979.1 hypothetical protein JHK85_047625 [Glycine max]KAG5097306.1 hypothetical protein JHK82_047160 [Glycine max]KAG5102093.1 hypothetical protein JHK84_047062 [Glycine max]